MADLIDKIFFKDLSQFDPLEVCARTLCTYDHKDKYYRLTVWGREYCIYPFKKRIESLNPDPGKLHEYFDLFAIHYLLTAKSINIVDQWVSERDIPGGAAFFRGPHAIPTALISSHFNNDMGAFKACCDQLGGIPLDLGDAAYRFDIAPRIPVAVLYWIGDEDFQAEAKILYDKSIGDHLALDIVFALAVGICMQLGQPVI